MKRFVNAGVTLLVLFGCGVASASYIAAGNYNYGNKTYWINGQGGYCVDPAYNNRFRQLSGQQFNEMQQMTFSGLCYGYLKGPANYQGHSYYMDGVSSYCEKYDYQRSYRELPVSEANQMFNFTFIGYCES